MVRHRHTKRRRIHHHPIDYAKREERITTHKADHYDTSDTEQYIAVVGSCVAVCVLFWVVFT